MKSLISTIALTAGLAAFGGFAHAQEDRTNEQRSNTDILAQLNATLEDVAGDVAATAAAIGSTLTVEGTGGGLGNIYSRQLSGDVTSDLSTSIGTVSGDVSATSAAIANTTSLSMGFAGNIDTGQYNYDDVSTPDEELYDNSQVTATLNATLQDVAGDVAATSAAIGNTTTIEGVDGFGDIASGQYSFGEVTSDLQASMGNVSGDVSATSAAIANTLTVETPGGVGNISNYQNSLTDVTSDLSTSIVNVTDVVSGDVSVTSAAIANTASLSVDFAGDINNSQFNDFDRLDTRGTPIVGTLTASTLDAVLEGVAGDVAATSAAIGNTFTVDGPGGIGDINTDQQTIGLVTSDLQTTIGTVTGDVSVTSAAIANTVTIGSTESADVGFIESITNSQFNGVENDPSLVFPLAATLNASIEDVTGDVSATSAALANSATIDAAFNDLNSQQFNVEDISASLDASFSDVNGAVAATAAAIGNSLTVTGLDDGPLDITSNQDNGTQGSGVNAAYTSQLNASLQDVAGDVAATSAAIANTLTVEGVEGSGSLGDFESFQSFVGVVTSDLTTSISNVAGDTGDVSATSAAIINTASLDADVVGSIDITQENGLDTFFPELPTEASATLNATIQDVSGDVSLTSAALANSITIDAAMGGLSSEQINTAPISARLDATIRNVSGAVTATSAAIGNSLTITGF